MLSRGRRGGSITGRLIWCHFETADDMVSVVE